MIYNFTSTHISHFSAGGQQVMAFQGPYVETVLMGTRGHIPQVSERESR